MKHNSNKAFLLVLVLIVIIFSFLYKDYSVKLQEEKEKEIISAQLEKEKGIIKEKEKVDENIEQENQIEKEKQKELLNSCLKGVLDLSNEVLNQIIIPRTNECIEMGDKNPTLGIKCFDSLDNFRSKVEDDENNDRADCYKKYPQK